MRDSRTVTGNRSALAGKKVLVVDDDVRNIFALTSLLEDHNLQVVHAENGRAGIEVLKRTPDIDLVLMDIMMPGMDGYETIQAIRQIAAVPVASDHRSDGQSHEGRSCEVHRCRRIRLHHKASRSGATVFGASRLDQLRATELTQVAVPGV